jgi:hypothetical protein
MPKFTLFYLFWASLWSMWGILIGNNIVVHLVLLVLYIMMMFYLTTPTVQWYFHKVFRYGKYVLYTRMVSLKSGFQLPIYFFSKNSPKTGQVALLPEGYMVEENKYSHMPYLKKEPGSVSKQKQLKDTDKRVRPVFYVVNNTRPTASQYPWIIRNRDRIISNHRTKKTAIKRARVIAVQKNGRVLVQKTNGQFMYGFTPKTMKRN